MSTTIVNGSECYGPFKCLDVNGNLFMPTSLSWQLWDVTNNVEIVPPTPITPVQIGTVTIPAEDNVMNTASILFEARTLTLKVGIPGGTYQNVPVTYTLSRAAGTP